MSYTFIPYTAPSYIALSTDVSGSKIDGVSYIGATVYLTDTQKTYIVLPDLTLAEIPSAAGASSSASAVEITNFPSVQSISGSVNAVVSYAYPANFINEVTSDIVDTTATQVVAAGGAGFKNYITTIMATNSGSATGTFVNITSGSEGGVLWSGYAAKDGGGFVANMNVPIMTAENSAVYCKCETTGANVRVCVSGYKGA